MWIDLEHFLKLVENEGYLATTVTGDSAREAKEVFDRGVEVADRLAGGELK
jgi:hypothetical protein